MFLQGGLVAAQIGAAMGGVDEQAAGLVLAGAGVGAQLITTRYGREAELESDLYGTRLMKAAGYDPRAAITLQETFVRLSEGRQQNWMEGLFASHPPSAERVAQEPRDRGRSWVPAAIWAPSDMQRSIAPLRQMKPGYDKYDQALAAMQKKDVAGAQALAAEAVRLVPREGQFHQLLGDIDLNEKRNQDSLPHFRRAHGTESRTTSVHGWVPAWRSTGWATSTEARQWLHAQHGAAAHGTRGAVSRQHGA